MRRPRMPVLPALLLVPVAMAATHPGSLLAQTVSTDGAARLAAGTVEAAPAPTVSAIRTSAPRWAEEIPIALHAQGKLELDLAVMGVRRPGYPFWQHIFTIPDGSVAFGSRTDGRLLAVLPVRGDWHRDARWLEPSLAGHLNGRSLPSRLSDRRDELASLLEPDVGPVLHNATRGRFLLPNARRYGSFLEDWGAIYERFGVPAEIGLAQAIIESGLHGKVRSEAGALGFCQWLSGNWGFLKRLSPHEIEGYNQTTQAPYCAAYLTILATKYGSFIPALSEHHAGGTNVGRILINGERLGGDDVRERYFMGSELAQDLRAISLREYRDVVRTYGPRSALYAEMVFGNAFNVVDLRESMPQTRIHAMRAPRNLSLQEIARHTGLSVDEIRRFNPALIRQVPRTATLYLPEYVEAFGEDVAFWHRPPPEDYASLLNEFLALDHPFAEWDSPSFLPVLRDFQARFRATSSEEGVVMSTMLAYVIHEAATSRRADILADFRTSSQVMSLFDRGVRERTRLRGTVEVAR